MAPKESPPRKSGPASASSSGSPRSSSRSSPRSSPPRKAPAGTSAPLARPSPPHGSATGSAPPRFRAPRDIPLSEITPPAPARGQYAALYLTVSERTSGDEGIAEVGRRSALVVHVNPSVNQFANYRCVNLGVSEWEYKATISNDGPRMRDYSLLVMEFVAWIPRAEVSRLSEIMFKVPYPKRGDPDWNSQKWVRRVIGKLMEEGLLTDQEGGRTYLKQQLAVNSIAFTGFFPNRPRP